MEGRATPALFVIGWTASVLGLALVLIGVLSGQSPGGPVVLVGGMALLSIGLIAGAGSQAIDRRVRGGMAYHGPSPVLVFAVTIPISYVVAFGVGLPLAFIAADIDRPVAELLLIALQAAVTLGVVRLVVVGTGGLSWAEIGFTRSTRTVMNDVAWGVVMAGPAIVLTIIASVLLVTIFAVAPASPLPPTGSAAGLVLHLVAGAIVAPFAEEVMFRGVATTAWVRTSGVRAGIVRAALLFGAAHVLLIGGDSAGQAFALAAVGFLGRLPVALILGWVFVRRRTIWAPCALHAVFNAALIVLAELAMNAAPAG